MCCCHTRLWILRKCEHHATLNPTWSRIREANVFVLGFFMTIRISPNLTTLGGMLLLTWYSTIQGIMNSVSCQGRPICRCHSTKDTFDPAYAGMLLFYKGIKGTTTNRESKEISIHFWKRDVHKSCVYPNINGECARLRVAQHIWSDQKCNAPYCWNQN